MTNEERILKATGKTIKTILERIFEGQHVPTQSLETIASGNLEGGVKGVVQAVQNPYDVPARELAPRLVGVPIVALKSNPLACGIITHVAPYIESKADIARYATPRMQPGMFSLWHSNSMGGYDVGIISARSESEDCMEYVAIFQTRIGADRAGMKETARLFTLRDYEGANLNEPASLLIARPLSTLSMQRGNYAVTRQAETKKGAGCTESYLLK